jgi:CRISPR-associated exonuclease Cas4
VKELIVFAEEDLLPISALQHLLFCPRQCALIHIERLWAENRLTVEGRQLHKKADAGRVERRRGLKERRGRRAAGGTAHGDGVCTERAVLLRSLELGLFGRADVIEFVTTAGGQPVVRPVEYKRGKPKKDRSDVVQLCAQAMCLEEMLGVAVPAGAIFYGVTRRRVEVPFDESLRALTRQTIDRLHAMIRSGRTPPAKREKKCERCSLVNLCLPDVLEGSESASRYLRRSLLLVESSDGPASGEDKSV